MTVLRALEDPEVRSGAKWIRVRSIEQGATLVKDLRVDGGKIVYCYGRHEVSLYLGGLDAPCTLVAAEEG